jgi:predicted outer membrane repeat protein
MQRAILFLLPLAILGMLAQPALAACPGTSTCKISACPPGATPVIFRQSIQSVIDAAVNGDTICVKPGTYSGNINFNGKRITLVSSGGPTVTILNGGGLGSVVAFNHSEAADSVLDGFQIVNGRASGGGGILILDASPVIRNCILKGNRATGASHSRGGGVYVGGVTAQPAITCTQFLNNQADFAGGGLATLYSAAPYLRNDSFEGNTAPYGGGIAAHYGGRLDVGTTSFLANQASGDGGGIHTGTPYGNVLVRNCWFKGNTASGYGGGLWVPAGLAQVVNCTFDGNQAYSGGGIAAGYGGMADVASTLFVNNKTTGGGSSTLVNTDPGSNTSVVSHYNGFFGNTGGNSLSTYGNLSPLLLDPQIVACCPGPGSPALGAGIPDDLFVNTSGTRNDMGACGGPAI